VFVDQIPVSASAAVLRGHHATSRRLRKDIHDVAQAAESAMFPRSVSPLLRSHVQKKTQKIYRVVENITKFEDTIILPMIEFLQNGKTRVSSQIKLARDADRFAARILLNIAEIGHLYDNTETRNLQNTTLVQKFREIEREFSRLFSVMPSFDHAAINEVTNVGRKAYKHFSTYRDENRLIRRTIGIYAALEHEFQSVLRRMDTVEFITGESCPGHAILKRQGDWQDVRDLRPLRSENFAGAALGRIGRHAVLLVCGGETRDEDGDRVPARDNVAAVVRKLEGNGFEAANWLVVGVCAATCDEWPLGTVLVSERVHELTYSKSNRFDHQKLLDGPFVLEFEEDLSRYKAVRQYRPLSALGRVAKSCGLHVSAPHEVMVKRVPFACVGHVIKTTAEREELVRAVESSGEPNAGEIGIEMELGAVAESAQCKVAIIKAVCDYGDDRKGEWTAGLKNMVQLYAADVAADIAVQLVSRFATETPPETSPPRE
jgi:hypothetical protein